LDPGNPMTQQPSVPMDQSSAFNEALASAGESGTQPAGSYMPGFFGDFLGGFATDSSLNLGPSVVLASGFKIAESDSPRPMDRFYYLYNGYLNIDADGTDLHRHIIGFEKTFLGGDASIGLRLPFFSFSGGDLPNPEFDGGFTGDLVFVGKYALINNRTTGNVLSLGTTIAMPTGGAPSSFGNVNRRNDAVYFGPYVGYIYNLGRRLYFHGFHGVGVPTIDEEPTFMTNDVGLGFWLYRNPTDSIIRAIIPTVEIHVNTPFNQKAFDFSKGSPQTIMLDSVNLTSGIYVQMPRSVFGGSVSVPLAYGPHTIEALASYTMRF
jgi:hypothetical protein